MDESQGADEDILCFCEWLTREDIIAAMPTVTGLQELREATGACMTCFGCEADLEELVAQNGHVFGTAQEATE